MRLTREEQEMLEGKFGYPVQKSMEILVGLGECFNAEKMIPVDSVHLTASGVLVVGQAEVEFIKKLADAGGRFVTFTDTNTSAIDPWAWRDLGIPEDIVREELSHNKDLERMGAFLCNTCSPHLVGNVPRMGRHVAWVESSAVLFVNSVFGARANREGCPSALAAALTGRVPAYGYHLDQNRYGQLEIKVTAKLNGRHDYGTLGYFTGKIAEDRVPVLTGVPQSATSDELKLLGAAAATSGSVALCHIVGITPEAPTKEAAFGMKKVREWQTLEFGEKELRETEELITKAVAREVDLVIFGCPHASIEEIKEVAQLLSGKRLKAGVELWVLTSRIVRSYAEVMGYVNIIEEAGAKVLCDLCSIGMPKGLLKERGHKTMATNSAKMCYYMAAAQNMLSHYGSTERCVEAAISGMWR